MPTASPLASLRLTPWPKNTTLVRRISTLIVAFGELLWLDLRGTRGYGVLRRTVERTPVARRTVLDDEMTLVRVAMRDACIFYIKPVHCLQRSSAVTRMLRRRGVNAQLIIGHSTMPVRHHAWVEVDGRIVWDRLPGLEHYKVDERI